MAPQLGLVLGLILVLLALPVGLVLAIRGVDLTARLRGAIRTRHCPRSGRATIQGRHGYTAEGKLWKGHRCTCRGWHCFTCDEVHEKRPQGCCR